MAQKSLSVLHRIDTSMTWDMRTFNKKFKWMSYSLWIVYTYFYKTIFFVEQDENYIYSYLHINANTFLNHKLNKKMNISKFHKRFSYYISLYAFEFLQYTILLSLFFQINLSTLKKKKLFRKKKINTYSFFK